MITIALNIGSRFPVNRKRIRSSAMKILNEYKIENAQVDISVVGVRKITELNENRLGHDGSTDVLSFPLHEKKALDDFPLPNTIPPHLGDIVISFPAALEQAKRFGRLVDDQICFFVEHGMLHLLGYHHEDEN